MFTAASSGGLHGCSASILDSAHALTAAHCILGLPDDAVLVFATRFSATAAMRPVTAAVKPSAGTREDIAVLTFSGGLPPGAEPVVLASNLVMSAQDKITHAGYGVTSLAGTGRGTLRQATGRFVTTVPAQKRYRAESPTGGICSGDSGGPDYVTVRGGQQRQLGVHVSGGCDSAPNSVSSSTDVRQYITWIRSTGASPQVDAAAVTVDPDR
jgi:hypothetical protein